MTKRASSFCLLVALFLSVYAPSAHADHAKKDVVANCGAVPNDAGDDTSAIQTCINQAGSYSAVYFPPGNYKVTGTLTISNPTVTLYSDTREAAVLSFSGCGASRDLIKFSAGTSIIFNGGVSQLSLYGSGTCAETAIHVQDGSGIHIDDVSIKNFTDSSEGSEGIRVEGRELFDVRGTYIQANNPVVIGRNSNSGSTYIDSDQFHFHDLYTSIPPNQVNQHWHVAIADGVSLFNTTFDQALEAAGGCGFLKWVSTTVPQSVSTHLKIAGLRHEQRQPSACDKMIDIEVPSTRPLQELIVENSDFGENVSGNLPASLIYTNYVDSTTISDTSYSPSAASNFVNINHAKWLEFHNNYISYLAGVVTPGLTVKSVFRGKDCCNPPGTRTPDTGIWTAY